MLVKRMLMVEAKLTVCLPVMFKRHADHRANKPTWISGSSPTNTDLLFARLFCLQLPIDFTLAFNRFLNLCFIFHDFSLMYLSKAWTVAVNSIAIKPAEVNERKSKNWTNFRIKFLTQFVFIS